MKRITLAILTSIAMMFSILACAPSTHADTLPPAIFLTPHQDDESLSMGSAIREHILAGRDVKVILLTDGSMTYRCATSPYPSDGSQRGACSAERDMEFTRAVQKMGAQPIIPVLVAPGNTTARAVDGQLTRQFVENVVKQFAGVYGSNASFKTLSMYDSIHPDHQAIGWGLSDAYDNGYVTDVRWYVRREDQKRHAGTCTSRHNLDTALAFYYPVPGNPYTGVGYLSVPTEFKWANHGDGIYGPAAYSKVFGPTQRVPNGGSYAACYPNM